MIGYPRQYLIDSLSVIAPRSHSKECEHLIHFPCLEEIYERTILGKDTNSLDTMKTFGACQEHIAPARQAVYNALTRSQRSVSKPYNSL